MIDGKLIGQIFFLFWAIVIVVFCFWALKKGRLPIKFRNWGIKRFVDEILEDYGVIEQANLKIPIYGGKESVRLLRCKKDNEEFFLIETTINGFSYVETNWTRLDGKAIQTLFDAYQKRLQSNSASLNIKN